MPVRYFCGHCGSLIVTHYFDVKLPRRCKNCGRELRRVESVALAASPTT